MQLLNVNELIPHKKNGFFFDDIEGEPWIAFLESIETSGVIEPIIATQDKVIVSGHQRIRACKALGIEKVWTDIRTFDSEDEVLKQLIETNIRQRGVGNTNAVKLGRCIAELERIYGIKQGGDHGNQYTGGKSNNVGNAKSQDDLLTELGMNKESYRQYKKLTTLPEDIQQMVIDGIVTPSVASRVIAKLSPEEQAQLAEQISGKEKVTGSEVQQYINELKAAREENAKLRTAISEQGARNAELQHKLENRPPARVEIKEVEVPPADYKTVKAKAKEADDWRANYDRAVKEKQSAVSETLELKSRIRAMENQTAEAKTQFKLEEDSEYFAIRVYDFIKKNGGYVWIFDKINELPEEKRQNFVKAICALDAFTKQMTENIGEYVDG